MAYTNLSHSGKSGVWGISAYVSEIYASGNYRTIQLYVDVYTKDFDGGRDGTYSVYCAEADTSDSGSIVYSGTPVCIFDQTFDVYVEPGESYADIDFSFDLTLYSAAAGHVSASGSISTISGLSIVSDAVISAAKDIYFGDNCSISWVPTTSSFYYQLEFTMGEYSFISDILYPGTTATYTYTGLTVPLSAAENIPNTLSGTMSVSLYQYSDAAGNESIGATSTASFKVTLPDSIIPTITSCDAIVDNSTNSIVQAWGVALAGYSRVKLTASASGAYGSSITGFSISGSYKASLTGSSLDYTGTTITSPGNKQFIITCTDSRGRTSEQVVTNELSFVSYSEPKVTSLSVTKNINAEENAADDRIVITAAWEYDQVNGNNSISTKIYYKVSSAVDWTPYDGTLSNGVAYTLSNFVPDELKSYYFKVEITDALGNSHSKDTFSSTTAVLLDFKAGGDGLGVGKICENPGMEVAMKSTFYDEVYIANQTLAEYIRSTMMILSSEMFGTIPAEEAVQNPSHGQIYFKKIV